MQPLENRLRPGGASPHEQPRRDRHQRHRQHHAQHRRQHDGRGGLGDAGPHDGLWPGMAEPGTQQAADQRMAGGRGNSPPPRYDIPCHGAHQRAEDDLRGHHILVDDALAHGFRHLQTEGPIGGEVEHGGKQHRLYRGEQPCGDHRGDGIGGIVQAVQEIEGQRHRHQRDQQRQGYYRVRHGAGCLRRDRSRDRRSRWRHPLGDPPPFRGGCRSRG